MKKKGMLALSLSAMTIFGMSAEARYIFYFIGDGMGLGHVNTTEIYNREVLKSQEPLLMLQFPVASQARSYSGSHPITDSAAGGTALATGCKTRNGMIGENADSVAVSSIATRLLAEGYGVGIASTVAGDDATPAAFYAHAHNRGQKEVIAPQAATSGFQFFGGPVWRYMSAGPDWVESMKEAGYTVCYDAGNFTVSDKVLLLSSVPQGDQAGYTLDSIPGALTARQLTEACLEQLQHVSPDKFFMMIEGGNIDWAAHANDGGSVIKEILNYQEAIDVAYKFYLAHPDETLIVVTADHDTGGMAFGRQDNQKKGNLALIDFQKISKDRFSDFCRAYADGDKQISWDEMKAFLEANLGFYGAVALTEKEDEELHAAFDAAFIAHTSEDQKTLYNDFNAFSVKVFDTMNRKTGIGFTTTYHSGNFVPVYAIGAGSEKFAGCLNNIEIPKLIMEAATAD